LISPPQIPFVYFCSTFDHSKVDSKHSNQSVQLLDNERPSARSANSRQMVLRHAPNATAAVARLLDGSRGAERRVRRQTQRAADAGDALRGGRGRRDARRTRETRRGGRGRSYGARRTRGGARRMRQSAAGRRSARRTRETLRAADAGGGGLPATRRLLPRAPGATRAAQGPLSGRCREAGQRIQRVRPRAVGGSS
jgi:hypothetical protein